MPKYIFLDNWVLDQYTREDKVDALSKFITKNDFTILITSLLLTEVYNPGWENPSNPQQERGKRVAQFFANHPCVIIDQKQLFRAEISNYPNKVNSIPIELSLENLPANLRYSTLLDFLRADPVFVQQGKDIQTWRTGYENLKESWTETSRHILDHAVNSGTLHRSSIGKFIDTQACKDNFLLSLDRRHFGHFSKIEREHLGPKIVELFLGQTKELPAVRLTSLCFWHMYVEFEEHNKLKQERSDIGDFYHMSFIPYCHTFTIDGTMFRLFNKIRNDIAYSCQVLNENELNIHLGLNIP